MNTKWIKVGVGAAVALLVVAGLSFGAVTNAQAQSSWFSQPNSQTTFVAWPGGPGGMGMRGQAGSFATIAKALGMNETDLLTELRSGKSVADVAKEKNIDLSKVVDAIVAERTDQLKQAVTNGRITQQQADDMVAKLKTDLPTTLSNKFPTGQRGFAPGGPGGMMGRGMMGPMGSMTTIAQTLGISETNLLTELQSGKSVADVAKEKNVDLSKVVDAVVAERTTQLKQAVTSGRITQQQADDMIAKMKTDLPTMLSNKFPTGQKGFGPGQPGGMMGRGMMGFGGSPATIAQTLGISETNLLTEFQSGKSVADVAQEQNIDLNRVVDALVTEATTHLKQAVTAGRLTQAQADQMIATLKTNLPHLLSLKHNPGGMMGPGHRFGGRRSGQPGTQNQAPSQGGAQQSDNPGDLWEAAQST